MKFNRIKMITEMAAQHIKVTELSQISGVSRATISAVRCGKSCSYDTATKIAKALNLDIAELVEAE